MMAAWAYLLLCLIVPREQYTPHAGVDGPLRPWAQRNPPGVIGKRADGFGWGATSSYVALPQRDFGKAERLNLQHPAQVGQDGRRSNRHA